MLYQSAGIRCSAVLVMITMVSACASQAPKSASDSIRPVPVAKTTGNRRTVERRTVGEHAAEVAISQVGIPYRYGGSTTTGFDCSGLISYSYAVAGRAMPRTTSALWQELRPVASRDLQVGDVLFFDIEGKMSHVGLYLGEQRFVHAPSSGKRVSIANIDTGYYRQALIRGGRPR